MIKKDLVQKNFSRGSETYEEFAKVQKYMAKELINFGPLEGNVKILEIGSGTGILTRELLKKYPNSQITIMDISNKMLDKCKKEFGFNLDYILADAETYEFLDKYDLIISNATFQWFENLDKSIEKFREILNPKGEIIFSTFCKGTYEELSNSFLKVSPGHKYSQNFVDIRDLVNYGEILKSEVYTEYYESLIDFLKAIKAIGAQSSLENKRILTKNILKKVEEVYLKGYGEISVSNVLAFVKIEK